MRQYFGTYNDIISIENLLLAWREFLRGKKNKQDVQEFQYRLMNNILELHHDLKHKTYTHGGYHHFKISNPDTLWLLNRVIRSFSSEGYLMSLKCKGLPLGNLTSQLLVNIYMNEFDQWMKHTLKAKCYIRYADDFVILSNRKHELEEMLKKIDIFLQDKLKLQLHPNKVYIKTYASGVDFLGWVHFADHRVLRTATKKRMLRRLKERKGSENEEATRESYMGMLGHGNAERLRERIDN